MIAEPLSFRGLLGALQDPDIARFMLYGLELNPARVAVDLTSTIVARVRNERPFSLQPLTAT